MPAAGPDDGEKACERGCPEVQELGRYLKEARERKGMTLKELQEATKIRTRYLEAIEQGDFSVIVGEVYLKGFLKAYAEQVGLDPQEVIDRYTAIKRRIAEENAAIAAENAARMEAARRARRAAALKKGAWALLVALAILLVAVLVMRPAGAPQPSTPAASQGPASAFDDVGKSGSAGGEDHAESTDGAPGIGSGDYGTGGGGAGEDAAGGPGAPAPQDAVAQPAESSGPADGRDAALEPAHRVEVEVFQKCWMEVTGDGRLLYSGILMPGEHKMWSAERYVRIHAGNAGGIRIYYNGEDLGIPGRPGQVIRKTFGAR